MIQTESPYYQPTPPPPAPFTKQVGLFPSDPDYKCAPNNEFSGCDESWGLIIRQSSDIFIAGAGLYSWFSTYTQTCIDSQTCQKVLALLDNNGPSVRIQHLITIGAKYMTVMNGVGISAFNSLNVATHPFWSQVSVIDVATNGSQFDGVLWIDPKVWEMPQPAFTCSPPCHVQLPPWTEAASTINYPLITVSSGTWKSTITRAPLTVTQWAFKRVTITAGAGANKRQAFGDFYPTPATATSWPAVVYTDADGSRTTIAPTVAVPPLPASIGPNVPAPPEGYWPPVAMRAVQGLVASPLVDSCYFPGDGCLEEPFTFGDAFDPDNDDDGGIAFLEQDNDCPKTTSSTTTTTRPKPTPSPRAQPHPSQNHVTSIDSGDGVDNSVLVDFASKFCDIVGNHASEVFDIKRKFFVTPSFSINFYFSLNGRCQWAYNQDVCMRYLKIPIDACNCATLNGKQGGSTWNDCMEWGISPDTNRYNGGGGSPFDGVQY